MTTPGKHIARIERSKRKNSWVIAAVIATAWAVAWPLAAQVDCSTPGRRTPAVPVPECVDANGFAVDCATAGSIRLWPGGFRPASDIHFRRDSTDRLAGNTLPGRASGHELFASVDIVTVNGVGRRLYAAYNAGFQVWDIATDPADPVRLRTRDGWLGQFLEFPAPSEVVNYIEDVSALNLSASVDVVAVAGKLPVGLSLWEFDPTTESTKRLYQDKGLTARQVRLMRLNNGKIYAIVGADEGLAIYDVTAARAHLDCLDTQGSSTTCGEVFRGYVTREASRYVDALHVPANDRIFVSSSGGLNTRLRLWELAVPRNPASAIQRMSEIRHSGGSALFRYKGHYYLAVVSEEDGLNKEKLRILWVSGCFEGFSCSFADGRVQDAIQPISLDPIPFDGYATANDFLTHSAVAGRPYLYYGFATGNLEGPDLDRLFDLRSLRPPSPQPLAGLPEVTATGGSYVDPCHGVPIRYWSHYYSGNHHGLNNMVPRIGKFSPEGYFYRAAATILDVHVLTLDQIFADGFESGDVARWSQIVE